MAFAPFVEHRKKTKADFNLMKSVFQTSEIANAVKFCLLQDEIHARVGSGMARIIEEAKPR